MDRAEFLQELNNRVDLQKYLFIRGFLVTDQELSDLSLFPFYGNWNVEKRGGFSFLWHNLTNAYFYERSGRVFFLLGHAYNPFTMEYRESEILEDIAAHFETENYFSKISELTGVFVYGTVFEGKMEFLVDPSGMQSACYGRVKDKFYLSSHAQLIGDLCSLEMDEFVKKLISYKWYNRVMGPYLPCDLTPFIEIKRIVPDIAYSYDGNQTSHKRFWPLEDLKIATEEKEYQEVIANSATILRNNMTLIARKWNRPWISLTGGIDSNTTFAAANGNYDQFETFSYLSAPKEEPDVEAAKKIANTFGVEHHLFLIPSNNDEIDDYQIKLSILRHNNAYVAERYDNESRKRMFMEQNCSCDVEVKSWVSETIRGYWYKHYGRKRMPKLSAKLFRNLYKIFICNRRLAKEIDKKFERYIDDFEYRNIPKSYPPADMHYHEVTWGSWGGLNISEMKYCFDITIPYNNRKFLQEMFKVPLLKRIRDEHHLDLKKELNKDLFDMNIRVVNMKETKTRARLLNLIFIFNSILPF